MNDNPFMSAPLLAPSPAPAPAAPMASDNPFMAAPPAATRPQMPDPQVTDFLAPIRGKFGIDDDVPDIDVIDQAIAKSGMPRHEFMTRHGLVQQPPGENAPSTGGGMARSFGQGVVSNFGDELRGFGAATRAMVQGYSPSEAYGQTVADERRASEQFAQDSPWLSGGANLVGSVVGTAPLAGVGVGMKGGKALGAAVGLSAAEGGLAAAGDAEGGLGDRASSAVKGALIGGATGGTFYGAGKLAQGVFRKVFPGTPENMALDQISRAFQRDGVPLDVARRRLYEWEQAGAKPEMLFELGGENVQALARASALKSGAGRDIATDALAARQGGQAQRVARDVADNISDGKFHADFDTLNASRKENAQPLYGKANAGGSIAPLETQYQNAFGEAVSAHRDAAKALADANTQLTIAKAGVSRAGNNVYAANGALASEREAQAAVAQATRDFERATQAKDKVLERLQRAQLDRETNAPGAIWSPRIQEYLDDPIARKAMARGVEEQRLEALARGQVFDPREYAIVGMKDGEPVVGKVPNMRLLDAYKSGLDGMLEEYRDKVTGKLVLDRRGRALVEAREGLVKELDRLNPDYAPARAAWAGPSQSMDSMQFGRRIFNAESDVTAKRIAAMPEGDKEFFLTGVAQAIRDKIDGGTMNADAVKRFFNTKHHRERLREAFPDDEAFARFEMAMEREALMHRNAARVNPHANSRTALNAADLADDNPALEAAGSFVGRMANGAGPISAATGTAIQHGKSLWATRGVPLTERRSEVLSERLFDPNYGRQRETLSAVEKRALEIEESRMRKEALARALAGGVGGATGDAGN